MAISISYTFSFILLLLLVFLFQFSEQSQLIASDQIKLWSENVVNRMPKPIMSKLSPLTKKDCDYFVDKNDDTFKADSSLCTLAQLACSSEFYTSPMDNIMKNSYMVYTNAHVKGSAETNKNHIGDPYSFFRVSKLKNGNILHLPKLEQSLPHRSFLPNQIASKISLTSTKELTNSFPKSNSTILLNSIETTLTYCNANSIEGETKICPKSLEELISFSKLVLGGKKVIALTSESTKGSNSKLKIKNVKKFDADKIVACHELFLPFATYFCHSLSSTHLYKVDFVDLKTEAPVNSLIAICHMDTSAWPPNHVAFHILKFTPGQGEACHLFTQLDLAWISAHK